MTLKKSLWFQLNPKIKNIKADCRDPIVCDKITKGKDYIFNLACDMGGMGFIENNKALCMLSSVININLLKSAKKNKIKNFFIHLQLAYILHIGKRLIKDHS